jgi:hypothetical protein
MIHNFKDIMNTSSKVFKQIYTQSKKILKIPTFKAPKKISKKNEQSRTSLTDQYKDAISAQVVQDWAYFTEDPLQSAKFKKNKVKFSESKPIYVHKKPSTSFHYLCFNDYLEKGLKSKGFKNAVLKNSVAKEVEEFQMEAAASLIDDYVNEHDRDEIEHDYEDMMYYDLEHET